MGQVLAELFRRDAHDKGSVCTNERRTCVSGSAWLHLGEPRFEAGNHQGKLMDKSNISCVGDILALAALCTSDAEATEVLDVLKDKFCAELPRLVQQNDEAYLEEPGKPHIRFELVNLLSSRHAIAVVPEIRDGNISLQVILTRFNDGLGFSSRDYSTFDDFQADISVASSDTVEHLAAQAKDQAIALHFKLVQEAGVDESTAGTAVQKAW